MHISPSNTVFFFSLLSIFLISGLIIAGESSVLQTGWKFAKGPQENAQENNFDDTAWETIQLPHDWAIAGPFILDGDGNTGKLPWKGEGWYRHQFDITESDSDKRFYLLFDGVMAFPKVYLNGKLAGEWDYGYNSFYVDITDFLNYGSSNLLAVHVDTRQHDSRWYPGAGIYRKVQLIKTNPLHIAIWGNYVTTPIVKPHYARVEVQTTVENKSNTDIETVRVVQTIINPDERKIAEESATAMIPAGGKKDIAVHFSLNNPRRWDIEDPALYQVKTRIYNGDALRDSAETNFGIRTIRFTADHGFYLNDRRVQLKGVNLHHDFGPLGAAFYPRAMERQLEIMKTMGCNAIRNSHNTAAPELLELCDRMGLLMFNEIFDKYDGKAGITPETDFEDFAQRNIHNFVVRDRNHPSIFLWSVGNEIGDVQWNIDNGFQRLNTMISYVRKYDLTRPVTLVCDNLKSATLRHFDYYDVHAWNYDRRYRLARQLEPNKSVIISESASTLSTRGFYELPLPEKKTDFTRSLQISSYDLHAPYWAEIADDDFMWQQDEPYIAGEFVWTGFDYLGEPTPYNNQWTKENGMKDENASRSSYFGIVDLVGIPKDRYYLYKSYWLPDKTTIHILPHWNWENSGIDSLPVFVYTNGDEAELFLNGASLGKRSKNPTSDNSVDRFRLIWQNVPWQAGELKAVAYREGEKIGENIIRTTGAATNIRLTTDRKTISPDGQDLAYVLIEAYDKNGIPHPLAMDEVQIEVDGPGEIAGVGNGNPQSFAPFQTNKVKLFYGKAMLIIKSGFSEGQIKVKVRSAELKGDAIRITVK